MVFIVTRLANTLYPELLLGEKDMREVKKSKSQKKVLVDLASQLKGNHLTPSEFKNIDIQGQDEFTGSLRALINFEHHTARIWIGKRGQVRDLDGAVLSHKHNNHTTMLKVPPSLRER